MWFDKCTVWFVASLSFISMTFESWSILIMSRPLMQYQVYNHLPPGSRLSDYQLDIALLAWHNIYIHTNVLIVCYFLFVIIISTKLWNLLCSLQIIEWKFTIIYTSQAYWESCNQIRVKITSSFLQCTY